MLIYGHSVLRTFLQHRIPSTDTWLVSHILQKLTMRQLVEFFSFLISIPIGPFTLLRWKSHESCACLLSLTHTLKRTTCFWTMSTFPYFQKLNSFASWIENNEYSGSKYKQLKHITKTFKKLYLHEFISYKLSVGCSYHGNFHKYGKAGCSFSVTFQYTIIINLL